MNLQEYFLIKQAAKDKEEKKEYKLDLANGLDQLRLKYLQGEALGRGYNGIKNIELDPKGNVRYKHTTKSRLRQLGAAGMSTLGAAGGAFAGSKLTNFISNKLGLDNEDENDSKLKKTLKSLAKAGLIATGTIGGGIGGYLLGTTGAGFLNGRKHTPWNDMVDNYAAKINTFSNRRELKNEIKKDLEKRNVPTHQRKPIIDANLDLLVPVEPY